MMSARPPIAVFGATGLTASFVAAELTRRGWPAILLARDVAKLEPIAQKHAPGAELRPADSEDPAGLDRALARAGAVINCAGPFMDSAAPLIEAALRAGIHYVDVTAEQATTKATFDRYGRAAAQAGIVVAPAFAFYGGLADLLATVATDGWTSADEILVAVALDSWLPTRGTRVTGDRNTTPRVIVAGGELWPLQNLAAGRRWEFPEPFGVQDVVDVPLSEVITISRHLAISELRSYMNEKPLKDLHDPDTPPPSPADERGRSAQLFCMDVIARRGEESRRATASGRDIYAVTAPIVVEAATRIVEGGARRSGVSSPGELFDAREFLEALDPESISISLG